MNSDVYNIHSRQKFIFHLPLSNSSQYQKGKNHFGIEVFNDQPPSTISLTDNIKKINSVLKYCLHAHSTCSEYFNANSKC
jgi:hypothetical protein